MDPNTRAMVTKPIYNNITFHRVIKNFMVQTGDPTATGSHDCGFTIKDEFVPSLQFDQPFLLGMANIGAPNSGACQFFITVVPTPWLNNKHTIFGKVVEGQDIVTQIDNAPTGPGDKPNPTIKLISVTIKREGPPPAGAATTAPAKKATTTAPKTTAPVKKQ
jgi:cyclophilin family peptidyl-prolyl cis-trans isomerase